MSNLDYNKNLIETLNLIRQQMEETCDESTIKKLDDIKEDIKNDFFTIVILGEFKRGKSTFVNALLGKEILPMDVIPTTATINALMWSEEKKTYVVKADNQVETGESSLEFLSRYVASESFDVDKIKYLKVGYPSEILKDNIVIVDTPGVSDINEQRVQVTYDFIPRANAVIFLLDATSPLKRTEKEFIDEHLIKLGIDRVLFIANKFDNIDEEDEEEVLEDIQRRLKNSFKKEGNERKIKDLTVIPMSSGMALKGVTLNDEDLIIKSGLNEVKEKVLKIIKDGSVAEEKIQHYKKRMNNIVQEIERKIENQINLHKADVDDLKKVLSNIDAMVNEESKKREKIYIFIENEEQNISSMVRKSLNYFQSNLKDEINDAIDNYKGLDFKEYAEKQIPSIIKKSISRWVGSYSPYIEKLLEKLKNEVSVGLANYFRTKVIINNSSPMELEYDKQINYLINIEAEDISNVNAKAGLIAGGVAGAILLAHVSFLLPVISMAAFPIFQKKMLEGKLNDAKINTKPEINNALNNCMANLNNEILNNISNRIDNLKQSTDETYNQLFKSVRNQIQVEIDKRKDCQNDINEKVEFLENKLINLKQIRKKL